MLQSFSKQITLAADGTATDYLGSVISGSILAIRIDPGAADDTLDVTITGETSLVPILTKANVGTVALLFYPRAYPHLNSDGSQNTTAPTEKIHVIAERIKAVLAQGGTNTPTVTITALVNDNM